MQEYLIVRNFVSIEKCNELVDRIDSFYNDGIFFKSDNLCHSSPAFYGVFNDELLEWHSKIEELVGKKLHPTYTYSRIYQHGEMLVPHTDRAACEYSFTLNLKSDGEPWPMYVQTLSGPIEAVLNNGDILIYKGVEQKHWRTRLKNRFHYQGFFHYVEQEGRYDCHKYDGRETFASTQDCIDTFKEKYVSA